jgi:hypothetical protein
MGALDVDAVKSRFSPLSFASAYRPIAANITTGYISFRKGFCAFAD